MGHALDRILAQLERVKSTGGDSHIASCPVPDHGQGRGDRNPSLSITLSTNHDVLINCQGGCHTQDVLLAIGLDWPDLFENPVTNVRGHKVAEWIYQDRGGAPHQQVERWQGRDGKFFKQKIPGAEKYGLP